MSKLEHASGLQCSPDSKTTEGQTDHTAFSRPSFYDHPLHSTGLSNLSNNVCIHDDIQSVTTFIH